MNRKTWRRTLGGHEAIIERWGRRDLYVRIGPAGFFLFLPWREARDIIDAELVLACAAH